MEFKIEKIPHHNLSKYRGDDVKVAEGFAKDVLKELKNYVKAIALFGSTVKQDKPIIAGEKDIDILIIIDDLSIQISPEFVEAYRIIIEKLALKHSKRLHITTLKISNFWDYMRVGDPIGINILRTALPLYDIGFFEPLQALLKHGRIRPSQESVWVYFARSPATLKNSRWHLLQATLDLYWAVIDAAHAALMSVNEIPPSPAHVADIIEQKLVKPRLVQAKYATTMRRFYEISKMIVHRQVQDIKGEQFEQYFKEAEEFVEVMRRVIERKNN
jgi:predicted nucleotidyltransferase/uncharacterized protein (UPF0332 family)